MYLFQPERVNVPGQVTCIYIPPCIYFNHAPSQNQAVFLLTFTFHYVSISTLGNPTPSAVSIKFTFHYVSISTDCWLNRKSECVGLTFHYVSISTRSDVHGSVGECLFTFHYVSISTNSKEDNKRLLSIYIPLCIYFNLFPNKPNPFFTQFTFHYVSISTFTAHFISDIVTCIYIPLCTYFNRRNCCINSASSRIYIPLCIYFNYNANGGSGAPSSFTFHYVSISTFCFERTYHILHHLHSTMYLFQLHSRSFILISFIIYIPLCIYFNLLEGFALGLVLVFTFHYVSISTSGKTLSAVKRLVFTFHYVSISTQRNSEFIDVHK